MGPLGGMASSIPRSSYVVLTPFPLVKCFPRESRDSCLYPPRLLPLHIRGGPQGYGEACLLLWSHNSHSGTQTLPPSSPAQLLP